MDILYLIFCHCEHFLGSNIKATNLEVNIPYWYFKKSVIVTYFKL